MTKQKYKYKNISEMPQTLRGAGVVEPGATIEVSFRVENPNFEYLDAASKPKADTKSKEN